MGLTATATDVESAVVLISPYEIGRQPFGLAHPAAWLSDAGVTTTCNDLAVEDLNEQAIVSATAIGFYLAMHTATRLGLQAIDRVRQLNPECRLFAFGLYAPMNELMLRARGVDAIFSGEPEPAMLDYVLATHVNGSNGIGSKGPTTHSTSRIEFKLPRRELLPSIKEYAHLKLPDGGKKTVAFAEATRGCKHLCRHCPVVPVYEGRFVAVPVDVVLADIAQQVDMGATHVSFGDPDFLNGPTHAKRVLAAMHDAYPHLTFDATIKVEHILKYPDLIRFLGDMGCLFVTSAFESFEDEILNKLDKGHQLADVGTALDITRSANIDIEPTFIPFTPWTTLQSFRDLLTHIVDFNLVDSVAPVQLAIRLLIPNGSKLFDIPGFKDLVRDFDEDALGYPWEHSDPRVDALQEAVMALIDDPEKDNQSRREIFAGIWQLAHEFLDEQAPVIPALSSASVPHPTLSEDWYCCAEPSCAQLGFGKDVSL